MSGLRFFDRPRMAHMIRTTPRLEPLVPDHLRVQERSPFHRHGIRRSISRFIARKRGLARPRVVGWRCEHKTVILNDNCLCRIEKVDS